MTVRFTFTTAVTVCGKVCVCVCVCRNVGKCVNIWAWRWESVGKRVLPLHEERNPVLLPMGRAPPTQVPPKAKAIASTDPTVLGAWPQWASPSRTFLWSLLFDTLCSRGCPLLLYYKEQCFKLQIFGTWCNCLKVWGQTLYRQDVQNMLLSKRKKFHNTGCRLDPFLFKTKCPSCQVSETQCFWGTRREVGGCKTLGRS